MEDEPSRRLAFDPDPTLVCRPVVVVADHYEILRIRLASFGPVLDVVGLQVTGS